MKHLNVQSIEFRLLELGFSCWLETLGYSESIKTSLPVLVREFLHYLESKEITSIKEASSKQVEEFYHHLSTRKNERLGGSLSQSHLNKYLYALRSFSTYLQKTQNSYLFVSVSNKKVKKEVTYILSPKEIKELIDVTENDSIGLRDRAMIGIYYGCGLRLSEGTRLKVSDIDVQKSMLIVRESKTHRQRYVPINKEVMNYLEEYLKLGRPYLERRKPNRIDYFFLSERGDGIQSQTLYKRLKTLQTKTNNTGLIRKKIGMHTLRHSIATHLLKNNVPIESISKFLGHSSIDSTQIYLHIVNEGI